MSGQSCSQGQECLLDTVCNGTICVCREGLYTLKIADTYNCVPGDPAKVGFTNEDGTSIVIELNANNVTATDKKGMGGHGATIGAENGEGGPNGGQMSEKEAKKVQTSGNRAISGHRAIGSHAVQLMFTLVMVWTGAALAFC